MRKRSDISNRQERHATIASRARLGWYTHVVFDCLPAFVVRFLLPGRMCAEIDGAMTNRGEIV